ncbi:MAG: hypothetical protein ACYS0D_13035 [Planctomycetota bacterium]|jgi:hypothetical protein
MYRTIGGKEWNVAGSVGVVLAALLAAPVLAEETKTTVETDLSARTVHGAYESIAPEGPGPEYDPPTSPSGTITPVGPFTGEVSEGFDTQILGDPFPPCVEDRVFEDQADLCSSGGCAHITPGWAFFCTILPHDTPRLYGSCSGFSIYTFDTPVTRFGGYFGSNAEGPPTATASFYDPDDNLIATMDVAIAANCAWTWSGWEASGTTISKVEVVSSVFGGAFVMMDDMEADFGGGGVGPVPAVSDIGLIVTALVLAVLGSFVLIRRRKLA